MNTPFEVGDLVILKSGGPLMTVTDVTVVSAERAIVHTSWFNGKKDEHASFPDASLKVHSEEK